MEAGDDKGEAGHGEKEAGAGEMEKWRLRTEKKSLGMPAGSPFPLSCWLRLPQATTQTYSPHPRVDLHQQAPGATFLTPPPSSSIAPNASGTPLGQPHPTPEGWVRAAGCPPRPHSGSSPQGRCRAQEGGLPSPRSARSSVSPHQHHPCSAKGSATSRQDRRQEKRRGERPFPHRPRNPDLSRRAKGKAWRRRGGKERFGWPKLSLGVSGSQPGGVVSSFPL